MILSYDSLSILAKTVLSIQNKQMMSWLILEGASILFRRNALNLRLVHFNVNFC